MTAVEAQRAIDQTVADSRRRLRDNQRRIDQSHIDKSVEYIRRRVGPGELADELNRLRHYIAVALEHAEREV